jgi:hypothetical protein
LFCSCIIADRCKDTQKAAARILISSKKAKGLLHPWCDLNRGVCDFTFLKQIFSANNLPFVAVKVPAFRLKSTFLSCQTLTDGNCFPNLRSAPPIFRVKISKILSQNTTYVRKICPLTFFLAQQIARKTAKK